MSNVTDASPIPLLMVDDCGERRAITLERIGDGSAVLSERSSGQLTMTVFGEPEHVYRIFLRSHEVLAVLQLFEGQDGDLARSLSLFFNNTQLFLSDLQDALDRADIDYACTACAHSGASYRTVLPTGHPVWVPR